MQVAPINTTNPQVSNYNATMPLIAFLKQSNDSNPKTSLPTEVPGTVQENTHPIPEVTLYNAHGIINSKRPNSLIGYA